MSIASSFCRGFKLLSLSGVLALAQHGGGHGGGGGHAGGAGAFYGGGGFVGRSTAPVRPTAQGLSGFPASAYSIGIPASAYSLNVTAVPASTLQYLTLWPTGQAQPFVSTLNSLTGQTVANAELVPAGAYAG